MTTLNGRAILCAAALAVGTFLAGVCGAQGAVWADGALTTAQLTEIASKGNIDIVKARAAVTTAGAALTGESLPATSRLSLSGGYDAGMAAAAQQTTQPLSGQAQVTVPVLPQLSLGGSVSSQGTASLSLSLTPFASATSTYTQKETYRKAVLQLGYLTSKIGYDVQSAAWAVTVAETGLASAEAALALQQDRTDVAEKSHELGDLSYEELQTSRAALITARQSRFDAQRALLNARAALYRVTGPGSGETSVAAASLDVLTALSADRDAALAKLTGAPSATLALRTLEIELDSLREQLAATPVYTPSLTVSGFVNYPLDAGASLSFSFSPSEIKTDDRSKISQSMAQKQLDIDLERMSMKLQAEVRDQALAAAREVLAARKTEVKQAETALSESKLLLAQGQVTSLETRQAELDLSDAQARLYAATASLLGAQADILLAATL